MVRAEGVEPPRISPLEPKSSASANSATPATVEMSCYTSRPITVNASTQILLKSIDSSMIGNMTGFWQQLRLAILLLFVVQGCWCGRAGDPRPPKHQEPQTDTGENSTDGL